MATLRRIAIDPVTRVEGHGKVTLLVDEHDRVQQARLHVVEFRGFERFIQGRPYWEVPVVVQRLCGICAVSHHLAASKALDAVVGAHEVTPTADRVRRLMHYGQVLQSHALHFFHLASPDLLFGADAEPERLSLLGLVAEHPEIARQGIALRRFGQEIIEATAGKRVHGTGSVPGGVLAAVREADAARLRAELPTMRAHAEAAVAIAARLHRAHATRFDTFAALRSPLLSLVRADGALDLYEGLLRVRDADGNPLGPDVPADRFDDLLIEEVRSWSYAKFPYLRALGPQAGWYRVGPLPRLRTCDRLETPRAEAARREFLAHGDDGPVEGSLAYHWARMIELLHCAEVIETLLEDPALVAGPLRVEDPTAARRAANGEREGFGVIEAPRGTLMHHFRVGDDDLVTHCRLIVSTTHNNQAMNEAIAVVARQRLDGHTITDALLNEVETAIRAFDPCLSCATHAMGAMPLAVQLVGPDGTVRDHVVRGADGAIERRAT